MTLKLPASIATEQDLSALAVEIHDVVKWLSHEAIKKKGGDKKTPSPPQMSEAAAELIHQYGASKDKLEELVTELEKLQKHAKIVTVTLAAYPTNTLKQQMIVWFRKEIADDVLLNFTFNKALLGGMVVRVGSRVFDWSFRRLVLDAGTKFPEVFHRDAAAAATPTAIVKAGAKA
jgi:hypothetical protein